MQDETLDYTISSQADESSRVPDWPSFPIPRALSPEEWSLRGLAPEAEGKCTKMEDISLSEEGPANLSSSDLNEEENAGFSLGDPIDEQPLLRFSSSHNNSKY